MHATLTVLGSGTSGGVPSLGCGCAVCTSTDPRDQRLRPSLLVSVGPHRVVIDTPPDFRTQALRAGLRTLDAVFYTHGHADHILGMDDLRPLTFKNTGDLPLYADEPTAEVIRRVFDYTFRTVDRYPTSARVKLNLLPTEPDAYTDVFGAHFQRIPVIHGREIITGYRFGSAAYITDMSDLSPESIALLQGLDILVLDALRRDPHPSHSHLDNSVRLVELLKPNRAYFTHMSHDLDHAATEAILPPYIRLAYDGLQLDFDIASEAAR